MILLFVATLTKMFKFVAVTSCRVLIYAFVHVCFSFPSLLVCPCSDDLNTVMEHGEQLALEFGGAKKASRNRAMPDLSAVFFRSSSETDLPNFILTQYLL